MNISYSVNYNENTGTGYTSAESNHRGLYASRSPRCEFHCNRFLTIGQGMVFEGYCVTGTTSGVAGNLMKNNWRGFVLQANGEIGQQGTMNGFYGDNKWQGTFTGSQTYVANTPNANTNSRLYVRSNPAFYRPTNHAADFPVNLFNNITGIIDYNGGTPYQCPIVISPAPPNPILKKTAQSTNNYQENPTETRWISNYGLYRILKDDTTLRNQEAVLDSFYIANQQSIFFSIEAIYSDFHNANYLDANSKNNALNTNNVIEENYKNLNDVLIKYYRNIPLTISDMQIADDIANQCPSTGGSVVYQARAFINLFLLEPIEFIDNCSNNHTPEFNDTISSTSELIVIYPNPSDGIFKIECTLQDASVIVTDILGNLVYSVRISEGVNSMNLSFVSNGIYFYTIIQNGQVLSWGKLEILR